MPSLEALDSFVHLVESGDTIEAMVRFYGDNASMQENANQPRVGKSALIRHEREALASIASLEANCIRPILISGDFVAIRWNFSIRDKKGKMVRFEEVAYQRWEGNHIVEERFFYDPAQLK